MDRAYGCSAAIGLASEFMSFAAADEIRRWCGRVLGLWLATKQHPKDKRERYDTHSHRQDQKNACYLIDNPGISLNLRSLNIISPRAL
jgi:hypothetical protein